MGRAIHGLDTDPECALWLMEQPMGSGRSSATILRQNSDQRRLGAGCTLGEHDPM